MREVLALSIAFRLSSRSDRDRWESMTVALIVARWATRDSNPRHPACKAAVRLCCLSEFSPGSVVEEHDVLLDGLAADVQLIGGEVRLGVADRQAAQDRQFRRDRELRGRSRGPRFSGWPPARSRASPASTTPAPPPAHFTTVHTDRPSCASCWRPSRVAEARSHHGEPERFWLKFDTTPGAS